VGDVRALTGEDPAWRAVAARALVRPEDRAARWKALLDPEPLVRRQAARAAADAADPDDLDALAEAVRLDPQPIVRTEAVRGLAALGGAAGGRVLGARRDLWRGGDDALREDMARAWSRSPLWESGGREELRLLVAAEEGPPAIEGAAAILARKDVDAPLAQS